MPETSLEAPLDILVVDDSPTYRMILSRVLRGWPRANLAGVAGDGMAALSAIQEKHPQLVLLDVSMPVLDGIETLRRIRKTFPDVDVVMLSSLDPSQTGLTMQALSLGALDFVPKPQGENPAESFTALSAGLFPLLELAAARHRRRLGRQEAARATATTAVHRGIPPPPPSTPARVSPAGVEASRRAGPVAAPPPSAVQHGSGSARPPRDSGRRPPLHPELVAIGVSTGGPNALHVLVPGLSADFPLPIVCVQHMPPLFTASLAERLDRDSPLKVVEGVEGRILEPGTLHIAPGGSHMVVVRGADGRLRLSLRSDPPVHSCRPSVDVLFRSIAETCQGTVVSVVLTGMGSDGAEGVARLRAKGSWSIVQDEATSVVWGMPGAVHAAGDADETLPLDAISRRLTDLAAHRGSRP